MLSLGVNMHIHFNLKRFFISLVIFSGAALLAGAPFPLLYRWIYEGNALLVESFFIVETEHVKPIEIREYLKDYLGKPFYGVDLNEMGRIVERHPWVESVTLRRAPPHEIVIKPVERKPVALADIGALVLVDGHGFPFQIADSTIAGRWPIIKPQGNKQLLVTRAAEALESYNISVNMAGKIAQIQFDENESLQVSFESGLFAELGSGKILDKWQKLDAILNHLGEDRHLLATIYLGDYPNSQQVAVKFKMDNNSRGYTNGSIETR